MNIKLPKSRMSEIASIESATTPTHSVISIPQFSETEPKKQNLSEKLNFAIDCEYAQKAIDDLLQLKVLAVTSYIPSLDSEEYFDMEELDEDFNVVGKHLERQGYQVEKVYKRELEEKLQKLWGRYYPKGKASDLTEFIAKRVVVIEFENLGIDIEKCELTIDKRKKIKIKFNKIKVTLNGFFLYADLFKIFGNNWRYIWTETAKLLQYRTIKIMGIVRYAYVLDGIPTDIELEIFDDRYVFPPRHGSLEGQARTYGVELNKISISEEIKKRYGDDVTEKWCKSNMDIVRVRYPDVFREYAKRDTVTTWQLHKKLIEMLKEVMKALDLDAEEANLEESFKFDLAETCGRNIENILRALIYKHFGNTDLVDKLMASGRSEALAKLDGNQYGILPSKVTGGLLFTRTAKLAQIIGTLLDLDEASCYATALCAMTLYLGQPVHLTYKHNKFTLGEIYKLIHKMKIPKDAWKVKVSGKLHKAINTLILNDLRFDSDKDILTDPERYRMPTEYSDEDETINLIDADKTGDAAKHTKVFYKEIKHGTVTEATMTALSDLPYEWYEEFENLEVDALIYYHPDLIANSIEEYKLLVADLPVSHIQELLTPDLQKESKTQLSKANVSLAFPIGDYYKTVKDLRKQYKDANNPVQEIFKLILNSTYGVMACIVMKVNNPIAANWITSCARAAAWRMVNALNGFAPITDGTGFKLESVPFGKTFLELLKANPNYLIEYDDSITNNFTLSKPFNSDGAFNQIFIDHLESFLGKSDWLTRMYKYDLKSEKGSYTYNCHSNTGAGNYVKSGEWGDTFKCRSYQELPELIEWFKEACKGNYKTHLIYCEKEVIKLSQGSIDAIKILKDAGDVANNNKRRILMPAELAVQIAADGICHPMGFSKNGVKLLKLISPSQFMCQDEQQYKLLSNAYDECKRISKFLLPRANWEKALDLDYLKTFKGYGTDGVFEVKQYEELDYAAYNQISPCGLGFEVLVWGNREIKSIQDARIRIAEVLEKHQLDEAGKFNLRAILKLQRNIENLENNKYITHLLAATQIIKVNFEYEYRQTLANSVGQPTMRVCYQEDITDLKRENSKL